MMKVSMAIIITLLLLATAGLVTGEEIVKVGMAIGSEYHTGTSVVLAQGEAHVQMNYEARGVVVSDRKESPFHYASVQCVGAIKAIKGPFAESGLCTYTRTDGDKIFVSYEGTGRLEEVARGTETVIGGTGKCENITGGGEWVRTSLRGPTKGVFASFTKVTRHWNIP